MIPLALLTLLQELPPPPETTGSPEIDTVRVVGVVIVSLGVIVLLALMIRPFVVKPVRKKRSSSAVEAAPAPEPVPDPTPSPNAIIPFPKALIAEGAGGGPSWTESNATIAERFNRVVGEPSGRRRKLGDRNPRSSLDLATAAVHRVTPEVRPRVFGGTASGVEEPTPFRPVETPHHWALTPFAPPATQRVIELPDEESAPNEAPAQRGPIHDLVVDAAEVDETAPNEVLAVEPIDGHVDVVEAEPAADDVVVELEPQAVTAAGPVDTTTLAALHQLVRDLIYCANAGELLQGFALYSDPYLFRFLDESGMSEEEFRDTYAAVKARPRDAWDHLDLLSDVEALPDGKIVATASYVNGAGEPSNGRERYRFVEMDGVWMIDDIEPV